MTKGDASARGGGPQSGEDRSQPAHGPGAPATAGVTAQEAFRDLVREHIGPELRHLGWRGSLGTWARPHLTHWVMLGLTRSGKHSTRDEVWFTVDLSLISKDEWEAENVPTGRRAPRPTPSVADLVGWQTRLASLGPVPPNWTVHPGDDLRALAHEVVGAIAACGMPEIEGRLAVAEAEPPRCWHNVGGHNWFQACGRPATQEVRRTERLTHRCLEHAEARP